MYKVNGRGSAVIDRTFKGIGRIARATGTDDVETVNAMKVMLSELYKTGRWNFLEAIRDGKLTMLQVYEKWTTQSLNQNPTVEGMLPAEETLRNWANAYDGITEHTRDNYLYNIGQLMKLAKADATVSDIPSILKKYKERCKKKDVARQFNNTRNTVRSFLKDTFSAFHPLYQEVVATAALNERPKNPNKAYPITDILALEKKVSPKVWQTVWTCYLTGVGYKEFKNGLKDCDTHIFVTGDKVKDGRRNRTIPRIEKPLTLVPLIAEKRLRINLGKVSDIGIYELRHSYSLLLREAGVPDLRVRQYMGHLPKNLTDAYGEAEMTTFLSADAEKVRAYITKHREGKINKNAGQFFVA